MIEGVVRVLGRDINTDLISSAKYFSGEGSIKEKLQFTLYDYDANFGATYKPGTILITGANFGCGSSREIGAQVFKQLGVPAIISETFARTFYRNSINIGLPIFEVPNVIEMFEDGQIAVIDTEAGVLTNVTKGISLTIQQTPPFIQHLIDIGGLLPYVEEQMSIK